MLDCKRLCENERLLRVSVRLQCASVRCALSPHEHETASASVQNTYLLGVNISLQTPAHLLLVNMRL